MPTRLARRELMFVALAFLLLTCLVTYPQAFQLTSHVGEHYDSLFGTWRLAWIAHQLIEDPRHLFDANIFFPEQNTLAYSDAALLLGITGAPLIWAGVKPVVVYNVLVLASFVASGTAMYVLVRRLTGARIAAWIAALIFAFQPYRYAHFPQVELLWTCWIPLSILALHDLLETRRVSTAMALGLVVSLQAWSSLYYAVFLVTGLGVLFMVWIARTWRGSLSVLKPLAIAAATAALLCGPYAVPYMQARETIGARTEQDVTDWSPSLQNYIATAETSVIWDREPVRAGRIEGVLFPGFAAIGLAIAGALVGRARTFAFVVLVAVAFGASLGANGLLYPVLRELLIPYEGLRVPGRMFVLVSAGMSVLAGYAVAHFGGSLGGATRRGVAMILGAVIVLEGLSIPLRLQPVPNDTGLIYTFLAEQPRTTILEWPLPRPDRLGFTQEPERMYASMAHWQRLANGYSGYYPPSYVTLLNVMERFPAPETFPSLRGRRVRYIVLHSTPDPHAYARLVAALHANPNVEVMLSERVGIEDLTLVRVRGV